MWDEIRVAAVVARLGTLTAASEALGIHRATVQRRVDALEEYIGDKLFYRHSHGYTATELGNEILKIAEDTDAQIGRLKLRVADKEAAITGDLIITSIDGYASFLVETIAAFSQRHPLTNVIYVASNTNLKLELGHAHIAFRMGKRPDEDDYVVLPHNQVSLGLYASKTYTQTYGTVDERNLAHQKFVLQDDPNGKAYALGWLKDLNVEPDVALASEKPSVVDEALRAGIGIGFYPIELASKDPSLLPILAPDPKWNVPCWIVTHVDLHRSPKVQAFLTCCREKRQVNFPN